MSANVKRVGGGIARQTTSAKRKTTRALDATLTPNADATNAAKKRLTNPNALLRFENVEIVLGASDVDSIKLSVDFVGGNKDTKTFSAGVGGKCSILVVWLSDDPLNVGDKIVDLRPPQ